ncbi:aminopeptidase N C-terminal domain-containing protein [Shigella sonnei]
MLETVRGLLQHRAFTMSNPNRIRSLIEYVRAATRQRSMPKMAAVTGSWSGNVTDLDRRNPQVASRLIEPLIRLKRYDAKRRRKCARRWNS